MLIPCLLLSSIAAVALSTGGRTAQDCTIGDVWTENFIRFECYQGTGAVVKGVRAKGCVPSNTASGELIYPTYIHDEQYFTYGCTKSGDVVTYKIINCRDSSGKTLAVGETRTMADGTNLKCYKDDAGVVKLSQEKKNYCTNKNNTQYALDQEWSENVEFKVKVTGVDLVVGNAVLMRCTQGMVATPIRCVLPSGKFLSNGTIGKVDSTYVQCNIAYNGTVSMIAVDESYADCIVDGKTIKNGETYKSTDGKKEHTCDLGIIRMTGCIFEGKMYAYRQFTIVKNRYFYCNDDGYHDFGNITGCTLPDGTTKPLTAYWPIGTEQWNCGFKFDGNNITAYTYISGCLYEGPTGTARVIQGQLATVGGKVQKCAQVDGIWMMRDLTADEQTFVGGSGGSGAGADVTGKPTTTTTTALHSSMTTTTRADTTTKLATVTTTIGRTNITYVPSSPTPVTDRPTTVAAGECRDLFEMCSSLAPICQSRHNLSMSYLKEIINSKGITQEQIKALLSAVGREGLISSSEEDKEEVDEVVRGLVGFDSDEEEDCGCRDEPCVNRCQRRKRTSCKKCQIFKRKVRELVGMVCPSTCGTCAAVSKVPDVIKALVRFYTHDCR